MQKSFTYLFWIVIFILAVCGSSICLQYKERQYLKPICTTRNEKNRLVLKSYNQQYLTYAFINGYRVKCLIDTGASNVSIPVNIAKNINLLSGKELYARTANGTIKVYRTFISTLKIGSITLENIEGSINPSMHDDYVLIGMSALKYLDMIKVNNILILKKTTENNYHKVI